MRRTACVVVAALALAGCGGAGSTAQPVCNAAIPAAVTPTLVYPAPGATGVPASSLTLQILNGGPNRVLLDDGRGGRIDAGILAQTTNPPPVTIVPGTWYTTVAQLSAHTTYTVDVVVPQLSGGCGIPAPLPPSTVAIGTFTTQ